MTEYTVDRQNLVIDIIDGEWHDCQITLQDLIDLDAGRITPRDLALDGRRLRKC